LWRDPPRAARDHERDVIGCCRREAGSRVGAGYRAVKLRLGVGLSIIGPEGRFGFNMLTWVGAPWRQGIGTVSGRYGR
jgi:hypothetical protein